MIVISCAAAAAAASAASLFAFASAAPLAAAAFLALETGMARLGVAPSVAAPGGGQIFLRLSETVRVLGGALAVLTSWARPENLSTAAFSSKPVSHGFMLAHMTACPSPAMMPIDKAFLSG